MGSLTIWHWMVVLAVVALLFGRGRISSLMEELGSGISKFKRGIQDDETDTQRLEPPSTNADSAAPSAKPEQ